MPRGEKLPPWREQAANRPWTGQGLEVDAPLALSRQRKAPFGSELPKGAVSLQAVARFILSA